jgi:hypothetical protein
MIRLRTPVRVGEPRATPSLSSFRERRMSGVETTMGARKSAPTKSFIQLCSGPMQLLVGLGEEWFKRDFRSAYG